MNIPLINTYKYLGIEIDANLTLDAMWNKLNDKLQIIISNI